MPREARIAPEIGGVFFATFIAIAGDACVPLEVTSDRGRMIPTHRVARRRAMPHEARGWAPTSSAVSSLDLLSGLPWAVAAGRSTPRL
jgi:hypothetical protein